MKTKKNYNFIAIIYAIIGFALLVAIVFFVVQGHRLLPICCTICFAMLIWASIAHKRDKKWRDSLTED